MEIFPFAQVLGAVEEHAAALAALPGSHAEVPAVGFLPRTRIAEAGHLHARRRRGNHGRFELLPAQQAVVFGGGEHLRLAQLVVAVANGHLGRRRVLDPGIDKGWDAVVDDGRPAEAAFAVGSAGRGSQRNGLMVPVDHVGADGVAPVHVAPHRGVRIELVEEVVLALPPDGSVGIVHPVVGRKQVAGGAQRVVGDVRSGRRRLAGKCRRSFPIRRRADDTPGRRLSPARPGISGGRGSLLSSGPPNRQFSPKDGSFFAVRF